MDRVLGCGKRSSDQAGKWSLNIGSPLTDWLASLRPGGRSSGSVGLGNIDVLKTFDRVAISCELNCAHIDISF